MFRLKDLNILGSKAELAALPEGKLLINTINAHSYNTARKDGLFAEALTNGDVLIPDGVSIVKACRWTKAKSQPKERIAGWDLFSFEMENLERKQCGMLNVECGANNSSLDNSQSALADNPKIQNSKLRIPFASANGYVHGQFGEGARPDCEAGCGGVPASEDCDLLATIQA